MTPAYSTRLIVSSALLALMAAGCKSAPPLAEPVAAPRPVPMAATLTDEQLVRAHAADGLGLGLRVTGSTFRAGEEIPFHVLMEDFGAREPIASGMCSGFSLTYDEVSTHDSRTGDIDTPHCFTAIPMPDEIPFVKGKLKIVDLTQRTASNMEIPPGTYAVTVTWKAVQAGKGTILDRPIYTTITSNAVQVTVTR